MDLSKALIVSLLGTLAFLPACKEAEKEMEAAELKHLENFKMHSPVVLVVDTQAERMKLEDAIVAALKSQGLQPVASHTFQPSLEGIDVEAFKGFVQSQRKDSVLTVEPFAAAVAMETREEEIAELQESNFIDVAEEGWTDEEVAGIYGLRLAVWESQTWHPVWVGEVDKTFDVNAVPGEVGGFVTMRVQGEKLY